MEINKALYFYLYIKLYSYDKGTWGNTPDRESKRKKTGRRRGRSQRDNGVERVSWDLEERGFV